MREKVMDVRTVLYSSRKYWSLGRKRVGPFLFGAATTARLSRPMKPKLVRRHLCCAASCTNMTIPPTQPTLIIHNFGHDHSFVASSQLCLRSTYRPWWDNPSTTSSTMLNGPPHTSVTFRIVREQTSSELILINQDSLWHQQHKGSDIWWSSSPAPSCTESQARKHLTSVTRPISTSVNLVAITYLR
jgi:hypothetical protein